MHWQQKTGIQHAHTALGKLISGKVKSVSKSFTPDHVDVRQTVTYIMVFPSSMISNIIDSCRDIRETEDGGLEFLCGHDSKTVWKIEMEG